MSRLQKLSKQSHGFKLVRDEDERAQTSSQASQKIERIKFNEHKPQFVISFVLWNPLLGHWLWPSLDKVIALEDSHWALPLET